MKRSISVAIILIVVLFMMLLAACGKQANGYTIIVPSDAHYSEKEIRAAMRLVDRHFTSSFDDCTLLSLYYDEDMVKDAEAKWATQYEADEAIILLSSFHVGPSGGDGSLNPNSDYTDWHWILVRSNGGKWQLKTRGYGSLSSQPTTAVPPNISQTLPLEATTNSVLITGDATASDSAED